MKAEAFGVTPRAWKILALGVVAIAGIGGFVATEGRSSSATKTPANWGLYSSTQWDEMTASFARRGFARDSVRMVTATKLANGQPFALIRGRSNAGRTCFAVVRGGAIGDTICRISKPLTVFYAPDKCVACSPGGPSTNTNAILALVRGDVTVTSIHEGRESGIAVVPAGTGFAFNSSFGPGSVRLRGRDAGGRVLASISLDRRRALPR